MLIITLGDPFSINVELVHRCESQILDIAQTHRVVLVGSKAQWICQSKALAQKEIVLHDIPGLDAEYLKKPGIYFLDIDHTNNSAVNLSVEARGKIAAQSLAILQNIPPRDYGKTAVVTLGVDKKTLDGVWPGFKGQTEFFEKTFNAPAVMILAGSKLRVGLVTNHLALRDVSKNISEDLIAKKISLFESSLMNLFGIAKPRIGVCGLNPHTSDHGLFGDEEEKCIKPAIQNYQKRNPQALIYGPLPADTVFHRALQGEFDGVLAMYHDQGLGPLKTIHFWDAINVSGGLPLLRVSVDHGPASDLYLQQKSNHQSFAQALGFSKSYLERSVR